jgi:hypothetical protein
MAEENPFKRALGESEGDFRPFADKSRNLTKEYQLRTIKDLGLVKPDVLERLPKVADLTVHDLNDLAAEFSGVPTENERVSALTLEDIQDIESVFYEFKVAAGRELVKQGSPVGGAKSSVDVSCCCCTPCCCCAATDMSVTA